MRTIHGNIISEENLEPKPNTEYIYNLDVIWLKGKLDMIWLKGKFESLSIEKGIIVENVEQLDAGNYSFNIKGEIEIYSCSYGWAFIENTERNILLLKEIDKETILLEQQQEKVERLRHSLDRLFKNTNSFEKTDVRGEK